MTEQLTLPSYAIHRLPSGPHGVSGNAHISTCGKYRYSLTRVWGEGKRACWIMLNPSTADADRDDNTIRRCIDFSQRWDCGSLVVVNLFAWRATKPAELRRAIKKHGLVTATGGTVNTRALRVAMASADMTIAAWGASGGEESERRGAWLSRHRASAGLPPLLCLGRTKSGAPRHPLMVRRDTELGEWI
jgi:hypothetical protein